MRGMPWPVIQMVQGTGRQKMVADLSEVLVGEMKRPCRGPSLERLTFGGAGWGAGERVASSSWLCAISRDTLSRG